MTRNRFTMTPEGFARTARAAGAPVDDTGTGWTSATHPATGSILQRDPDGYLTVHTDQWSHGTVPATTDVITRIWKGTFR